MTYAELVKFHGASNHWRLGEFSGTTAVDVIGGVNGTISGGVTLGQSGVAGSPAMMFNGTTGKIATSPAVAMTTTLTVEAWIKTSSSGGNDRTFWTNRQAGGIPTSAVLFGMDSNGQPFVQADALGRGTAPIAINNNSWRHVVWTQNGPTVEIYVDGTLNYTTPAPFSANTLTVTIGSDPVIPNFWLGSLDEVAIYPRALTAQEINAHYITGLTNNFIIPTTLISIGPVVNVNANEIYAIPNVPVILQAGAQVQTSILFNGPWSNVSNGQINGVYLKSPVNTTVKLTKYIISKD